ncbi:hypothetical protein [Haloferula sp. BvORR071]|uniref:hypothetical protein n=1 Tax=Haloferula sp. BvORR071 TaxID=1396141 RepID=UPI002240EF92|nr:hypothetical protein [Haloferula sp. BvORR071]
METQYGPYHRLGEPGGPGCPLSALPVHTADSTGKQSPATLLDAGQAASELEMLRSVAAGMGVRWGHDESGWWAVVPREEFPTWAVWRQDDHGNLYLVHANITESDARWRVADYEARGHKQTYFAGDQAIGVR